MELGRTMAKIDCRTAAKIEATTENLGIKACDRDKSGVYTKVNEHFGEGA